MAPLHQNNPNTTERIKSAIKSIRPILHQSHSLLDNAIKTTWRILLFLGMISLLFSHTITVSTAAKQIDEPTPTSAPNTSGAYITVIYIEPINVRSGPSSFDYPVIGSIPVGGTAPAIGRSPAGEWIQISFPAGPRGIGWVYAYNVKLSPGALLPLVEPPPTPVPDVTATANPTYVAALQPVPTSTRKPTFTAPPPLELPTYANPNDEPAGGLQIGWIIIGLGVVGLMGMAISSLRRH